MDRSAALRPLDEAVEPVRRLVEHRTAEELHEAIEAVASAVERSLRAALDTDLAAPDTDRLRARSPDAMPLEQVVQSLRARDRIGLETAGTIHELAAVAERARSGVTRPDDGEVARRALTRLRADLSAGGDAAAPPEPTRGEPATPPAPSPAPSTPPPVARGSGRWMAWIGAALAVLVLIGLAWALALGGDDDFDAGVAAFRAARWDSAAAAFERVLENRPVDVTSMLYLSRAYRRQGRLQEAAGVLREAARVAPEDGDVRRELGHLFMDLDQPGSAAQQYELAVERDPASTAAWAGLLRALRAMDDPRAERVLEDAPPEVRAALGPPDA